AGSGQRFHAAATDPAAVARRPAGRAGRSAPGAVAAPSVAVCPAAGSTGFHRATGLAGWAPPTPVAARTADPPAGRDPVDASRLLPPAAATAAPVARSVAAPRPAAAR